MAFTRGFDELVGQSLNISKSVALASSPKLRDSLRHTYFFGAKIGQALSVINLGFQLCVHKGRILMDKVKQRVTETLDCLNRIGKSYAPHGAKPDLVGAAAIPKLVYSSVFTRLPRQPLGKVRTKVLEVI